MARCVPVEVPTGPVTVTVAPGPADAFSRRTGVVTTFSDAVGAGDLVDDANGVTWYFHCTRLAGGSRTIDPSTAVAFRAEPGPTGFEAVDVTPLRSP